MPKKRKFIDKKKAVRLSVVARSQADSRGATEDGEQPTKYVLQRSNDAPLPADFPVDVLIEEDEVDPYDGLEGDEDDDFEFGGGPIDEKQEAALLRALGMGAGKPATGGKAKREVRSAPAPAASFGLFDVEEEGDGLHDYDYSKHLVPLGGGVVEDAEDEKVVAAQKIRAQPGTKSEEQVFRELGIELPKGPVPKDEDLKGDWVPPKNSDFFKILQSDNLEEVEEMEDDFLAKALREPAPKPKSKSKSKSKKKEASLFRLRSEEDEEDEGDAEEDEEDGEGDEGDEGDDDEEDGPRENPSEAAARAIRLAAIRAEARKDRLLDEQFDRIMDKYDDEEIGELGSDDERLMGVVTQPGENYDFTDPLNQAKTGYIPGSETLAPELAAMAKATIRSHEEEEEEPADSDTVDAQLDALYPPRVREQWDVESVISTYSTLENRPRVIPRPERRADKQIRLSARTGIPLGVLPDRKAMAKAAAEAKKQAAAAAGQEAKAGAPEPPGKEESEEEEEEDAEEGDEEPENLGAARPRKETPEERKARKAAVKAARAAGRQRKKALKSMYATEEAHQSQLLAQQRAANPGGVRRL